MRLHKHCMVETALTLLLILWHAHLADAQPAPGANPTSVSGTVTSLKGSELIVSGPSGDAKITIGDKTIIRQEVAIKFSEILSGMYVAATATKQPDGTFLASQINVFSEDQRGTGEGHRPLGNATMTNATVERVEDVMVQDVKGRMLNLKYKDGEIKVLVPPDIRLAKRVVADRSVIKAGSEVAANVVQEADGSLVARQITVRLPSR
jgi:uncharacterized protein DUF5666